MPRPASVLAVALMASLVAAGCLGAGPGSETATKPGEDANGSRPAAGDGGSGPPSEEGARSDGEDSARIGEAGNRSRTRENGTATTGGSGSPARFTAPVPVAPDEEGPLFEPGIEVAPDGAVYVTAAKLQETPVTGVNGPASPVWVSQDGGSTWAKLPSPGDVHDRLPGFEGDVAVDDAGHLYFVDFLAADNTFSRWDVSGGEPSWETTRPLQGTAAYLDDRPWLAASGDGKVYYLGQTLSDDDLVPAASGVPETPCVDPCPAENWWVHTSEDAGRTWSPGHSFEGTGDCKVAASPEDTKTAYVGCDQDAAGNGTEHGLVFATRDGGATWERTTVAPLETVSGFREGESGRIFNPAVAVDRNGTPYYAVLDDVWYDDRPGRVLVAHKGADGWVTRNVTPFEGSFQEAWMAAGDEGTVALGFYGSPDVATGAESPWYAYALVTGNATAPNATWDLVRLDDQVSGQGERPPKDFFQVDVGPLDRVHAAFHRDTGESYEGPFYVRQTAGPNLEGP